MRLEFRARKVEALLGALQRRARVHREPQALSHTIAAFEDELTSLRADMHMCGAGCSRVRRVRRV